MQRSYTTVFMEMRYLENKQLLLIGRQLSEDSTTESTRLEEVLVTADKAYEETVSELRHSVSTNQKFKKFGVLLLANLSEDERPGRDSQRNCSNCGGKLPSKNKSRCLFCGYHICSKCFKEDLLIYKPSQNEVTSESFWPSDFQKLKNCDRRIRWAVSGCTGYPEWDPEVFEYFPSCSLCIIKLTAMKRKELNEYQQILFSNDCEKIYINLVKSKLNVELSLQDLKSASNNQSSVNGSVLKIQEEIDEQMNTFKKSLLGLKSLITTTSTQETLKKNISAGNQEWFRVTKEKLENILEGIYANIPFKTLSDMQFVVEKMALSSAIAVVKQIFEEVMRLCRAHELPFSILQGVAALESSLMSNLNHLDGLDVEEFMYLKESIESHVASLISEKKAITFNVSHFRLNIEGKAYVLKVISESATSHLTKLTKDLKLKCRGRFVEESLEAVSRLVKTYQTLTFASQSLEGVENSTASWKPENGEKQRRTSIAIFDKLFKSSRF